MKEPKKVTRQLAIQQARILREGNRNPEFLNGMVELIAYCWPFEGMENSEDFADINIQAIIHPEGNLDQDPQEWLKGVFTNWTCDNCGKGLEDHTVVPLVAHWMANCNNPPRSEEESAAIKQQIKELIRKYPEEYDEVVEELSKKME